MSNTLTSFLEMFRISHRYKAPYYPECVGMTERDHLDMASGLRAALAELKLPQTTWTDLLPGVVWAMNTSPIRDTNVSPYEVLFGMPPPHFLDPFNKSPLITPTAPELQEYTA